MTRNDERIARAKERPLLNSLPHFPGIVAAMKLSPKLEEAMSNQANVLLFDEYKGTTLSKAEREMIATSVSASNDCFFCMDSHGAFTKGHLLAEGTDTTTADDLVCDLKDGNFEKLSPKMAKLIEVAIQVTKAPRALTQEQIEAAFNEGAVEQDLQLAIMIGASFAMYNRMVDGFRAMTPPDIIMHNPVAEQIITGGYLRDR